MKRKNKIGFFLFVLVVFGVSYFFVRYMEEDPNTSMFEAEMHISAKVLLDVYKSDKDLANSTFIEKIIEVEGVVHKVTNVNNRYTVFLEGEEDQITYIMCDMQSDQNKKIGTIKSGETIKLKGIFKGFLKDAILLNCVLLNDDHQ
ncbi:hypothetical protein [Aquimarina sp. SS2-1]|uniref:OB-fold protein n=1 Tax=Aquimarina besae TaxID=3342247 RepID=UPI00366CA1E2